MAAKTLATAEGGTGGLIANRLTGVAESSKCYRGGLVIPDWQSNSNLLEIDRPALSAAEPAGSQVAGDMAAACRRKFGADYGLAVTEFSRTTYSESDPNPPTACIALATKDGVEVRELNLAGDPAITRSRTAKSALNLLRLQLLL